MSATSKTGFKTVDGYVEEVAPIYVEWYGFDAPTATVSLAEGTYSSPTPVCYPQDASRIKFTWSVSDSSVATVDDQGVVTVKKAGDVLVYAQLKERDALLDDPDYMKKGTFVGASYKLTVTPKMLKASVDEVQFPWFLARYLQTIRESYSIDECAAADVWYVKLLDVVPAETVVWRSEESGYEIHEVGDNHTFVFPTE